MPERNSPTHQRDCADRRRGEEHSHPPARAAPGVVSRGEGGALRRGAILRGGQGEDGDRVGNGCGRLGPGARAVGHRDQRA